MTAVFSLLENPFLQLLLIAASGMGVSWISERNEQRRVAAGLPYRPIKERVLEGIGFANGVNSISVGVKSAVNPVERVLTQSQPTEDIWVTAAKELELPIEKVLL